MKNIKYTFKKNDDTKVIENNGLESLKYAYYDGEMTNGEGNWYQGRLIHDFYYQEGDIYAKLEVLESEKEQMTTEQYRTQKKKLNEVMPTKKTLAEISISPNHEFVHNFIVRNQIKDYWDSQERKIKSAEREVSMAEEFMAFVMEAPKEALFGSSYYEIRKYVENEAVYGTDKHYNALVRERRKKAANDIFPKFLEEELSTEIKDRFVEEFNRNYNSVHVPDYSNFPFFAKIHKNFKGSELKLTTVQKAGIGRLIAKGVGLLAHEVGFGKTLSGVIAMNESMHRGYSKRPLIVVPNDSVLKQWTDTIGEVIPNAKVNILSNMGKAYDLSKFNNHDGEITIVTYEGFNSIGFSEEITTRLSEKFNYISKNEMKSVVNSEREREREKAKDQETTGRMRRGKVYDWEDFGFDHLTFDEVHNANHIIGKVNLNDKRFHSDFRSQNQVTSKLGINTWMACQYIQEQNNGRNITLLSATPFTNKPLEYYSILSLIANKRLEDSGYINVNTFFETFMEADNDMEIDARGEVRFKNSVKRFKNNSLFQRLLSEFIDIRGEEDNPELKRPNKVNRECNIAQNEATKMQYYILDENFGYEKGVILKHILAARLIALSPFLSPYSGGYVDCRELVEFSPKLKKTMQFIRQNKKDLPNSGQIIYSELGVSIFPDLKKYLVEEVGYLDSQIGIISGKTTKPNRLKIQDEFNAGKVKVIIGSEAIQEGLNLQETTSDVYFLTLPYNFTTLRQLEGRAWRQGNKHENVRMNFMLINDSIDVFMLQKLQAKQSRYMEAMKNGANIVDVSDIDVLDLKTAIITNPETRADVHIELAKKRIENEKNRLVAEKAFNDRNYTNYKRNEEEIKKLKNTLIEYKGSKMEDYFKEKIDKLSVLLEKDKRVMKQKGLTVEQMEGSLAISKQKISDLDIELESLRDKRAELVSLYSIKTVQEDIYNRELENSTLF